MLWDTPGSRKELLSSYLGQSYGYTWKLVLFSLNRLLIVLPGPDEMGTLGGYNVNSSLVEFHTLCDLPLQVYVSLYLSTT